MVPENEMDSEWEAFAQAGQDWDPNGRQRLVVLARFAQDIENSSQTVLKGILRDNITLLGCELVHVDHGEN